MATDAGGKVRVVPHVAGRFACHVYIKCAPSSPDSTLLAQTAADLRLATGRTFCIEEEPHISLSKTFYARHWQLSSLHQKLLTNRPAASPPAPLAFDRLGVYVNEEETRYFVALDCAAESSGRLLPWVEAVNKTLAGFGFDPFYEVPRMHCSVLWSNEAIEPELASHQALERLAARLPLRWDTAEVYFKAGHQTFRLL